MEESERRRITRGVLQDGRALQAEGRFDAAERVLLRGLAVSPDDPRLHGALANALEAQGRADEARAHRERADSLLPPLPALPASPLAHASNGVLAILVPPGDEAALGEAAAAIWPESIPGQTLEERLQVRLPDARVAFADPTSVAEARVLLPGAALGAAISLRIDRVYCGNTIKDGHFGVARLRVAAAAPDSPVRAPEVLQVVVDEPRLEVGCQREVVARALEGALVDPLVADILTTPPAPDRRAEPGDQATGWSRTAIRALFPGLGQRIRDELDVGRALLAGGRVADADAAFARAALIDPDDERVRAYRHETARTLALARELSQREGADAVPDVLDPRLSEIQRATVELRIGEELRRREELLAVLAVLDEEVRLPSDRTLAALRPAEIREPSEFGPTLARERARDEVTSRVAYAPDGSVLARYYFPRGDALPVVREEDTRQDGRADRWIGYRGRVRRDIFEDAQGSGRPDLRLVFGPAGALVERMEMDFDIEGQPGRVLVFADGSLVAEEHDTDGDGVIDRYDLLDADGRLARRDEDLDGDGEIDVRSTYRRGELEQRDVSRPAL